MKTKKRIKVMEILMLLMEQSVMRDASLYETTKKKLLKHLDNLK